MKTAVQILEKLQESTLHLLDEDPQVWTERTDSRLTSVIAKAVANTEMDTEEMKNHLADERREKYNRKLPTKYEDPISYDILLTLLERVEKAAGFIEKVLPRRPVIGTVKFGRVNAMSILSDVGDHLVVFQDQLFNFVNLFAKAVALAIPVSEEDGQVKFAFGASIAPDSDAVRRFRELMVAYLFTGAPGTAPQYFIEGRAQRFMAYVLGIGMEVFVMGHEYAHLVEGHIGEEKPTNLPGENENQNEILWSWHQEMEADSLAVTLLTHSLGRDGLNLAMCYLGADLMLTSFDIVERARAFVVGNTREDVGSETHPPARLRREMLHRMLKESAPAEHVDPALALADLTHEIVNDLWNHTKPVFESAIKQGRTLAPVWGIG